MFSCFLCWDVNYCLFLYEHISDFQDKVQPPVAMLQLDLRKEVIFTSLPPSPSSPQSPIK